jgi:hypothetical protein
MAIIIRKEVDVFHNNANFCPKVIDFFVKNKPENLTGTQLK